MITVYLQTYGCQMNAYDTECVASMLTQSRFRIVSVPEDADVIVVNTCSVREHAENRAINRLQELSDSTSALLVVCGCMAQRLGDRLFDLVPGVRVVAGTDSYRRLPAAILDVYGTDARAVLLETDDTVTYSVSSQGLKSTHSRFLSITRGCENYCSYCIVPYLRGRVRCKDPGSIVGEINRMAESGTVEVTLLGQNVMGYRRGSTGFHDLLVRILAETDIPRLRFLTSHPRDTDMEVFGLMARSSRLCPHIHLPVQSGSNRILSLMKRGYRRERYADIVREAKKRVPGLAVTTDIIVGFPTESEDDFRWTIDLVEEVGFEAAFTFAYSPREGNAAFGMTDDVPADVKKHRLAALNATIAAARERILRAQLDTETEILLDGRVQKGEYRLWKGRTPHFRNVLLSGDNLGDDLREGAFVPVRLVRLINFTFLGEVPARR